MDAEELLRAGRLDEAQNALEQAIRSNPADAKLRVFFFQLLAIFGQWDRSLTQLKVAAQLDAINLLTAQMYGAILSCEVFRSHVFAGEQTPLIFGRPDPWMGWLVQANILVAQGNYQAATELRDRSFEAAPAIGGTVDGQGFEWLADADSRLGPMLEAIVDGKYYWVPFQAVKAIQIGDPKNLCDLVWVPADFTWTNDGQSQGFIPTRYPHSEASEHDAVRLARRTEWIEKPAQTYFGLGQRMFATDEREYAILSTRRIDLHHPGNCAKAQENHNG
ncbi:MAG: virulence protein SciE type [Planctomycetes bacterium RBG_13_60_9]|nr:MAG: virulence protein SciE type [Planctomycetes bacterium RBG_13_60_9]